MFRNIKVPCALRFIFAVALFIPIFTTGLHAAGDSLSSDVGDWWRGKHFSGNWLGVRDSLADRGITFNGGYTGTYYGVVDSERGSRGFYVLEIELGGSVDFAKLWGVDALKGLEGFMVGRYREGPDPNDFALASPNFQPSFMESGLQWRILGFGVRYTSPELFGVKDFLTFTGGWLQPQQEFIVQPLSKQFVSEAIESSKGVGANIPYSSSFSTWGGVLTIRPREWYYAKGAIFMAYENAAESANHGLAYAGYGPNPSTNGLLVMCETGLTPRIGRSALPGKYVFGGYYYGQPDTSYNGVRYPGCYGFYWQADQMLYREASASAGARFGGEGSKSVVVDLNPQGLSAFNLITYSPGYNQPLAFYWHTGLVYRGLIPGRDRDQLMGAFGYGNYSAQNLQALQVKGDPNQPTYSGVLEVDYRVQVNGWLYMQPYLQYIIRPNGTEAVRNATVLGFMTGVIF